MIPNFIDKIVATKSNAGLIVCQKSISPAEAKLVCVIVMNLFISSGELFPSSYARIVAPIM